MKTRILLIVMLALVGLSGNATNVSGGIYVNTTWTLVNSPYIVTDTIVVFPSITLTIEAGVVVKFDDNMYIELRQANIVAIGTATDSITFTSNSSSPTPGIWGGANGIWLHGNSLNTEFNYCNFYYAKFGITGFTDTMFIQNSNFKNNIYGAYYTCHKSYIDSCLFSNNTCGIDCGYAIINNCSFINNLPGRGGNMVNSHFANCSIRGNEYGISSSYCNFNNCIINNNQTGVTGGYGVILNCIIDSNSVLGVSMGAGTDSILNCEVKYNGTGLLLGNTKVINNDIEYNHIGIGYTGGGPTVTKNIIRYNGIGLDSIYYVQELTQNIIEYDSVGIILCNAGMNISCNLICNNYVYSVKYVAPANVSIPNNYWCSSDTTVIHSQIYDGHTNINYGLVSVFPADTFNCNITTEVKPISPNISCVSISPNPFSTQTTLTLQGIVHNPSLFIYNLLGQEVRGIAIGTSNEVTISRNGLPAGMYFYELTDQKENIRGKFIIQD